jgi:hypothetical protein
MMSRNIPLTELITTLDTLSDMMKSPMLHEASMRLDQTHSALCCLEDALFYARMYQSTDTSGEGERRRQDLIDDAESLIKMIRTGGLYE